MQKQDAHVYAKEFKEGGQPPWLHALYMHWLDLLKEPFKGVTNDGMFHALCRQTQYAEQRLTECVRQG